MKVLMRLQISKNEAKVIENTGREHNGKVCCNIECGCCSKELGAPVDMLVASNGAGDVVNHAKSVDTVEKFSI